MNTNFSFDRNSHRSDVDFTNYYWFETGFNKEELAEIEKMTEVLDFEDAATGQDDTSKISDYRKSKVKWCYQSEEWSWVYNRLHDMITEANDVMWKFDLSTMNEAIQYTEYYGGGGHYNWHMDCGIGVQNQRKVSVTVQLSAPDEYEGGDLEFNQGNIKTGPRVQGAAVIFPSFMLHRITPVKSGTRKSFVLWVGGEPYR